MLCLQGGVSDSEVRGKGPGLDAGEPLKLGGWRRGEVCGMRGVAVKCIDSTHNSD